VIGPVEIGNVVGEAVGVGMVISTTFQPRGSSSTIEDFSKQYSRTLKNYSKRLQDYSNYYSNCYFQTLSPRSHWTGAQIPCSYHMSDSLIHKVIP
jgi:hypothetical protein